MDITTLIICTVVVSLVLAVSMLALYLINRKATYLLLWSFSGLCFAASNLFGSATAFLDLPFWMLPVAANMLYMTAHAAVLCGVSKLVGNKCQIWVIPATAVITSGLHFLPFASASVENRMFLFYPIILSLVGTAAGLLYKARREQYGRASLFLFIVMQLFMLQLLVRAWLLLSGTQPLTFMGNEFLQTSGSLAVIGYILLLTVSFVIVEMWLRELRLRELANTDTLTGWRNRHALQHCASMHFSDACLQNEPLALIAIDLDRFKSINDKYGHVVGDEALRFVTQRISRVCCGADHRFRLGGEEFVIICPHTTLENAQKIAERIRAVVEECPLSFENESISMTVSIGVSARESLDPSWESILRRADEAMYRAKFEGRNRVRLFDNTATV